MRVKTRIRTEQFMRAVKARWKHPAMIIKLHAGLAEVWPCDGKAIIRPGWSGSKLLVVDWFKAMRFVRRRL